MIFTEYIIADENNGNIFRNNRKSLVKYLSIRILKLKMFNKER